MVVTGEPYNVLEERGNNAHGAEWHIDPDLDLDVLADAITGA